MKTYHYALLAVLALCITAGWVIYTQSDPHRQARQGYQSSASGGTPSEAGADIPRTRSKRERSADPSSIDSEVALDSSRSSGDVPNTPWNTEIAPASAPIVPPGILLPPPAVSVSVAGRNLTPAFAMSQSQRMSIQAGESARIAVEWPVEQRAREVFASVIHGGTVNGEISAVLKPGANGKFNFDFAAGKDQGTYQVLLRAANIEYAINFWVPTGNANFDPPAL